VVAERCQAALRRDLETSEEGKARALAELWLGVGITRSLVKGPVLAQPYGGSYMGICDSLVEALEAHMGYVPLNEFNYRVGVPARYMAKVVIDQMRPVVGPCMVIKPWLKKVVKKLYLEGFALEWTTPSGFPMRSAERMRTTIRVETMLYGKKSAASMADAPLDAKLDANLANRSICPNFVHSMDAAFLTLVVDLVRQRNVPVLTNHDCFATTPAHATELHNLLLDQFRGLYRTDWLGVFAAEIQSRTGVKVPQLPVYGALRPGQIGENPYIFS
jgi:DNA-directed RNA polymerase